MGKKSNTPVYTAPEKPAFLRRLLAGQSAAEEAAERSRLERIAVREAALPRDTAVDADGVVVEVDDDGQLCTVKEGGDRSDELDTAMVRETPSAVRESDEKQLLKRVKLQTSSKPPTTTVTIGGGGAGGGQKRRLDNGNASAAGAEKSGNRVSSKDSLTTTRFEKKVKMQRQDPTTISQSKPARGRVALSFDDDDDDDE